MVRADFGHLVEVHLVGGFHGQRSVLAVGQQLVQLLHFDVDIFRVRIAEQFFECFKIGVGGQFRMARGHGFLDSDQNLPQRQEIDVFRFVELLRGLLIRFVFFEIDLRILLLELRFEVGEDAGGILFPLIGAHEAALLHEGGHILVFGRGRAKIHPGILRRRGLVDVDVADRFRIIFLVARFLDGPIVADVDIDVERAAGRLAEAGDHFFVELFGGQDVVAEMIAAGGRERDVDIGFEIVATARLGDQRRIFGTQAVDQLVHFPPSCPVP